jgi:hypothetical protein
MALDFSNFFLLSKQRSRQFLLAATTLLLLAVQVQHARCQSEEESPVIRIVGLLDGGVQALPSHYVKSFQRWCITKSGQKGDALSIEGLPGTTQLDANKNGLVNPISTTNLWWPSDLQTLQVRPTLDVILHNGLPKYACGGLAVRVPPEASADGKEWRNFGLNSQPLASQWTTFASIAARGFRVEAFIGRKIDGELQWTELNKSIKESSSTRRLRDAMETIGVFLSGIDGSSPPSKGFHIVSIATDERWTALPHADSSFFLTSLATAVPDAKALLFTKPDVVAATSTSILGVEVSRVAPGGESEHLPEDYKALYGSSGAKLKHR